MFWRANRISRFSQALLTAGTVLLLLVGVALYLTWPDSSDSLARASVGDGFSKNLTGAVGGGGLRLCNKTGNRVGVAIGYKNRNEWVTEGWWNVGASSCETILAGPLVSRFYYVYAVDYDQGGEWSGRAVMCTRDKAFTITGTSDCVARGHIRTGFFEVDTGEQRAWTVQLTEPTQQGLGGR